MQQVSLASLLPASFLSLPAPPAYSPAGFPSVPSGDLALEAALPSGQGHDGAMAVDRISRFGWFWGAGERRGPDGKVLPSSLSPLCRKGLSKNAMRASPSSLAKVGLKDMQDGGKLGSLA